jgi:hypothetical protein
MKKSILFQFEIQQWSKFVKLQIQLKEILLHVFATIEEDI